MITRIPVIFQSTCPRGHDPQCTTTGILRRSFNPRAHEGTTLVGILYGHPVSLSIHVPTRARREMFGRKTRTRKLSIHVPTRARHDDAGRYIIQSRTFNPRAHEGTTLAMLLEHPVIPLSIHVPTRARPNDVVRIVQSFQLSIHVPTRARREKAGRREVDHPFNPRAHEGTTTQQPPRVASKTFQSTCPRGHDSHASSFALMTRYFQSTCPRGHDPRWDPLRTPCQSFNPRAHEGTTAQ